MKCCDAIGLRLGVNGFQVWQKGARFPGWVRRSRMPSYGLGSMALIQRERADAAWEAERAEIGFGRGAACERSGTSSPNA